MKPSNHKGFEIAMNIRQHLFLLTLWGLWDVNMAEKYKYALGQKLEEMRIDAGGWRALVDLTALYPRSEAVQFIIRECMSMAKQQEMNAIVYVGNRAMLQLRLDRIFPEQEGQQEMFIESYEKAVQWLLHDESSARR